MRTLHALVAFAALLPGAAAAVGLDRSGQDVAPLFEDGNYAELSFGRVYPTLRGTDIAAFGDRDTGNVAGDYSQVAAALKYQATDRLSFALIADEPYGSDILYPDGGSVALGGTVAQVDTSALTALVRYRLTDRVAIHGGVRYQRLAPEVRLQGAAYGGLSGYRAQFEAGRAFGYVIGASYEVPEIALRLALTYSGEMEHDLTTTETVSGIPVNLIDPRLSATSVTKVRTPESLNLDFQTGIAPDTLLFGNVRYAHWSRTTVTPDFFAAALAGTPDPSITDIEDAYEASLGIGRRLTPRLAGSISVGYEQKRQDLVSPLRPFRGSRSVSLGLSYDVTPQFVVSGGATYVWLGDVGAETGTPDVKRADFDGNEAFGVGIKMGYRF